MGPVLSSRLTFLVCSAYNLLPQRALSCSVYGYSMAKMGALPGFKREIHNSFLIRWCVVVPLAAGVVAGEILLLLILGPLGSGP